MSRPEYVLGEYETITDIDLSQADAMALAHRHQSHLTVVHDGAGFRITAGSWVGIIDLPHSRIRITPKVPISSILTMLMYAHGLGDMPSLRDIDVRASDSTYELMVRVLLTWVRRLIVSGLYRGYRLIDESSPRVRGKIRILDSDVQTARMRCVYSELSYSVPVNIVLKSTLLHLLGRAVARDLLVDCRNLVRLFGQIEYQPISAALFSSITYSRLNLTYRKILALCRAIYLSSLMTDQRGNHTFAGFVVDMARLFEQFVAEVLARGVGGVRRQSTRTGWAEGDVSYLPAIQPDIVIGDRLVIDTKYYRSILDDRGHVRSGHIYQVLTYMRALGCDGVLAYPAAGDAAVAPASFHFADGRTLHVLAIDLANLSFDSPCAEFIESVTDLSA